MHTTFRQPCLYRRCVILLVAGLFALSGIPPVRAANPAVLIKDINPTNISPGFAYGPVPKLLLSAGNRVFFVGADYRNGYEIWTSDGTPAGTQLVRDIAAGPDNAFIGAMATLNGKLFFSASDYHTPIELWQSDGTAAGTAPVRPQSAGGPTNPTSLTSVGAMLYFVALDAQGDTSLWKSDGTAAGTVVVKQLEATSLAAVGSRLFFVAHDSTHGSELWVSDGTAAGTRMVKDINLAGDSFNQLDSSEMTAVGNKLFFIITASGLQGQLWQSDRYGGRNDPCCAHRPKRESYRRPARKCKRDTLLPRHQSD